MRVEPARAVGKHEDALRAVGAERKGEELRDLGVRRGGAGAVQPVLVLDADRPARPERLAGRAGGDAALGGIGREAFLVGDGERARRVTPEEDPFLGAEQPHGRRQHVRRDARASLSGPRSRARRPRCPRICSVQRRSVCRASSLRASRRRSSSSSSSARSSRASYSPAASGMARSRPSSRTRSSSSTCAPAARSDSNPARAADSSARSCSSTARASASRSARSASRRARSSAWVSTQLLAPLSLCGPAEQRDDAGADQRREEGDGDLGLPEQRRPGEGEPGRDGGGEEEGDGRDRESAVAEERGHRRDPSMLPALRDFLPAARYGRSVRRAQRRGLALPASSQARTQKRSGPLRRRGTRQPVEYAIPRVLGASAVLRVPTSRVPR